jgi:CubicO group peptidase (beta-lactamase class C family)
MLPFKKLGTGIYQITHMRKHIVLSTFILFSLSWTFDSKGQDIQLKGLNLEIESLIPATINNTTPSLVVGVIHKGELIFSKGYGLVNLSYGIPNDPKMIYNLGSVSKQFLGYAFAILHTEGKIDVDEPVGNYLENWPEFENAVTIRHLLTHTSGYREAYTLSGLAGRNIGIDRLTRKECLDVARRQPELEYTPGSRFTYNSTAWVILAEILEKATGQSAYDWME